MSTARFDLKATFKQTVSVSVIYFQLAGSIEKGIRTFALSVVTRADAVLQF